MAQTLLDIQYEDVFGNVKCEKVVLYGDSEDDGLFMNQLKLVVAGKEIAPLSCELPFGGYAMHLYLGDFLSLGKDQILVVGQSGGSGDYTVLGLVEVEKNQLKLVCRDDEISKQLVFSTQLVNDEQAFVLCDQTQMIFLVEIDDENSLPQVLAPNVIYPIKQPYQDAFSLLVQQRIIGQTNSQTLGMIQSILVFNDQGKLVIQNQYLLEPGYEK